jgi:hypothetical protein
MKSPHYHAAIATSSDGAVALAIAHLDAAGKPQLDHVKLMIVAGAQAGIEAVYRGLRASGITVVPGRDRRDGAWDRRRRGAPARDLERLCQRRLRRQRGVAMKAPMASPNTCPCMPITGASGRSSNCRC